MDSQISYDVSSKEKTYFSIRAIFSVILYYFIAKYIINAFQSDEPVNIQKFIIWFYVGCILLYVFLSFGLMIGYIKGNAIRVNKNQFPDIYDIASKQSNLLGLKSVPKVYILQSGGTLNAFATRFMGNNYVVLYSEIVESAYEQDKNLLEFIIGHELGHVKRNHMIKKLLLIPSWIIPFLGSAYSRACEYTCDSIGYALAPSGLKGGLLILASGRSIYKKVNLQEYLNQGRESEGFWKWFAEKVSSHPNLTKRIAVYEKEQVLKPIIIAEPQLVPVESDHSKFKPF